MKSHTVFGTLEGQFQLRSISIIGTVLICLWILSPIGSQASLRVLGKACAVTTSSSDILYFPMGTLTEFETLGLHQETVTVQLL